MVWMTSEEREEAREHADPEERYGFCPTCECDVQLVKRDIGIGRYEFWGAKGIDRRMVDHCVECENEV